LPNHVCAIYGLLGRGARSTFCLTSRHCESSAR